MLNGSPTWQSDAHQASQHGEITERVDSEAPREAVFGENHRCNRWPDDAREIEAAGVQRDRVNEIFLRDELDDHRLPRGNLERGDQATHRGECEQPAKVDSTRPGKPP